MFQLTMFYKIIFVVLLAIIGRQAISFIDVLGHFRTVHTHWPGPCRTVDPITTGAEKIAVTKDGLAFITSGLVPQCRGEVVDPRMWKLSKGRIYSFDFNNPEKDAEPLMIDKEFDFMPHGMSLLEDDKTGELRLFVVNHRENEDTVEVMTFDRKTSTLHHLKTIYDSLFTSLNDVVADRPESFYVSNDGYLSNSTWRTPERLLTLPWGSIVHHDGSKGEFVVAKTFEPNGIAMNGDRKTMFVTMPFLKSVYVYKRDTTRKTSWNLAHKLEVVASIDNVYYHPKTGDLWLGALALPHMVAEAAGNMDVIAPASTYRLEPRGPSTDSYQSFQLFEVFADSTGLISTSSMTVEYDGKILVGSIFQKLVLCELETKY